MMIKICIIGILILGALILIFISSAILLKKEVYYKYIDTSKKITSFDYWNRYDGDWLFNDIGFKELLFNNPEDQWLIKSVKSIKRSERTSIVLFIMLIMFAGIMKYLEVL